MYGRLENGKFKKAKHFIVDGKATIINPTDEMYEKYGYKKLRTTEMPEINENQSLVVSYVETDSEIVRLYKVIDLVDDVTE